MSQKLTKEQTWWTSTCNFVQYHWLWYEGEWPCLSTFGNCLGRVRDSALVGGGVSLQTWKFQKSTPFPMCLSLPCTSVSKYKPSATATCLSLCCRAPCHGDHGCQHSEIVSKHPKSLLCVSLARMSLHSNSKVTKTLITLGRC